MHTWVESIWQDLRYGARLLRTNPGFAVAAVASLALGIGANTAIFQLLDAVRLRNLPVRDPGQLAEVRIVGGNGGMGLNGLYGELTRPIWQEIRRSQRAFSGVFAWSPEDVTVGQGSDLRLTKGITVSGDFFQVLGLEPWRGRLLSAEDEHACPDSTAVVSYAYWQSKMGGRDLGGNTKLRLNGRFHDIVGVTPPSFLGLAVGEHFDFALPFCQPKELARNVFEVTVMGRLRPGWTVERASAQLAAISPGIMAATEISGYAAGTIKRYREFRLGAYPAGAGVSNLRHAYDTSLWLLLGITGLVLFIACANLANLMLARASTREREIAVRLALGASKHRLVRQLLAESTLLAAAGAVLGVGLGQVVSRLLVWSLSTQDSSVDLAMGLDWRVFLFTAAVAALTCLIFGVAPALRATRTEPAGAMKSGGRGMTGGRERFSLQRALVVTQISVSLALLVGALLFVRSFYNLMTFNPGMREEGITLAFIAFQQSKVPPGRYWEFQRELVQEVSAVPGVLAAATTSMVPLLGGSWSHGVRVGNAEGWSKFTWVSPRYFRTMGIPILYGRGFTAEDGQTSRRVAVVNQMFVRRFLNGTSPIGRTLRTSPEPQYPSTLYEIVGVIPDTKYDSLRGETPPMTFAPAAQFPAPRPWLAMMIHSNEPPAVVSSSVKGRLAAEHPEIIVQCSAFQTDIRNRLGKERLMAMLSGVFGVLAAVLAIIGLYGVLSYIVARRRNEIGIRIALGAQGRQVIALLMREAARLLFAGVATGALIALLAGRAAGSLLFGLKSYDPATLAAAAGLLAVVAAAASFLPARHASRLDPMDALRTE